jgi:hypothetical protein
LITRFSIILYYISSNSMLLGPSEKNECDVYYLSVFNLDLDINGYGLSVWLTAKCKDCAKLYKIAIFVL